MSDVGNAIAIEAWNTVLFDKFCRFRYVLTEGLSGHDHRELAAGRERGGARIICGSMSSRLSRSSPMTTGAIEPASPSHRQFEYQTCCER
jgi:hypothetical protein